MANRVSAMTGGANSFQTTAEDINGVATDFLSDGIVGAVAATAGVAPTTGGLSMNAQGTPDRTVAIGAGTAYVTATPTGQASQRLRVQIAAQNVTHATNVTGSTRYDWIYVKVDATLANAPAVAGDTTGTVVVSRSTSSSVDNGTPPTYGYHIGTVTLTNGWTTVVNGNIADTRSQIGGAASTALLVNPYKFSVTSSTGPNLTQNVYIKVPFNTRVFDTSSNFDTVNNRFVAPVAGFYLITAQVGVSVSGLAAGSAGFAALYKNNAAIVVTGNLVGTGSATTIPRPPITQLIQLAANDYIELFAQSTDATVRTIDNSVLATYMSGFLVSKT